MTEETFEQVVRRYGDMLYRVAFHALRNRADAEDVTQTVLLRLYQQGGRFDSEEHRKHWLLRVAVNESRRLLRSAWRRRPLRVGLAAAALCALTVVGASAANPEFLEEIVLSIRSTVVVSDYQEELIMEDGSQITALRYPDVSVEERDGRTILTVDGAETDITDALSEDGRYVWEATDNGSQAQVIVTLDEDGKPVWVANVAAAGETFEEAGVSVVS